MSDDDMKKIAETIQDLMPTIELLKSMQESGLTETLSYLVENFNVIFNYTTKMELYDLITAARKLAKVIEPLSRLDDGELEPLADVVASLPDIIEEARKGAKERKTGIMDLLKTMRSEDFVFLMLIAMAISERMRK
ncbi:hypothetical protein DMB44_08680 [Thermoplasma sp. Kam2015]|uniref:hypothetical protein n=1 Tax=Thermoplasma sp. Kam2015 TaxID=2094122 RepID=UPI000D96A52C|nr:hypothetical protein [Thermoplasma sp. Kam2015]PYB67487.1 hypothetical protein DMB44_08680 [Thermoplasma sp. Kam2015]